MRPDERPGIRPTDPQETASAEQDAIWLATTVAGLLERKYGRGTVPSIRVIAGDIRASNNGQRFSHTLVHNILSGTASNTTQTTRRMLAAFFGVPAADLLPPVPELAGDAVALLAMRFSGLAPAALAAIEEAIEIVKHGRMQ
jgi:hypothetical protein